MANSKTTFTTSGIPEIKRAFAELPDRLAKKVVRQAIRASLRPVLASMKAKAGNKLLAKKLKIRAWPKRRRGMIALEVRVGDKDFGPGEWKEVVRREYGTAMQAARSFARPAFDENASSSLAIVKRLILEGIEREVKALRKS